MTISEVIVKMIDFSEGNEHMQRPLASALDWMRRKKELWSYQPSYMISPVQSFDQFMDVHQEINKKKWEKRW